jgi:hypothetical protein
MDSSHYNLLFGFDETRREKTPESSAIREAMEKCLNQIHSQLPRKG